MDDNQAKLMEFDIDNIRLYVNDEDREADEENEGNEKPEGEGATARALIQVFNDNFVAYYRSHVAHVNIMGRNFTSDHKLLGEIYEDLQGQIDVQAEIIRTLKEFMPCCISDVIADSHIDSSDLDGDSEFLLGMIKEDLEHLVECYRSLMECADEEELDHIANYAQERVTAIEKFIWMLSATLED